MEEVKLTERERALLTLFAASVLRAADEGVEEVRKTVETWVKANKLNIGEVITLRKGEVKKIGEDTIVEYTKDGRLIIYEIVEEKPGKTGG